VQPGTLRHSLQSVATLQPVVSLKCDQNRRVPVVARTGEGDRLLAAGEGLHPGLCQDEIATSFVGGLEQDGVVGITGDGRGAGAAVPGPGSRERVFLRLRNGGGGGRSLGRDGIAATIGGTSGIHGIGDEAADLKDLHVDVVGSGTDRNRYRGGKRRTVADVPDFDLAIAVGVGDVGERRLPGLMVVVGDRKRSTRKPRRNADDDKRVTGSRCDRVGKRKGCLAEGEFINGLDGADRRSDRLSETEIYRGCSVGGYRDAGLRGGLIAGVGSSGGVGSWRDD